MSLFNVLQHLDILPDYGSQFCKSHFLFPGVATDPQAVRCPSVAKCGIYKILLRKYVL